MDLQNFRKVEKSRLFKKDGSQDELIEKLANQLEHFKFDFKKDEYFELLRKIKKDGGKKFIPELLKSDYFINSFDNYHLIDVKSFVELTNPQRELFFELKSHYPKRDLKSVIFDFIKNDYDVELLKNQIDNYKPHTINKYYDEIMADDFLKSLAYDVNISRIEIEAHLELGEQYQRDFIHRIFQLKSSYEDDGLIYTHSAFKSILKMNLKICGELSEDEIVKLLSYFEDEGFDYYNTSYLITFSNMMYYKINPKLALDNFYTYGKPYARLLNDILGNGFPNNTQFTELETKNVDETIQRVSQLISELDFKVRDYVLSDLYDWSADFNDTKEDVETAYQRYLENLELEDDDDY